MEVKGDGNHMDANLLQVLETFNVFDSEDDRRKKLVTVQSLERVGEHWVRELATYQGMGHRLADKAPLCRVMVQGSTALGVSSKDGDIDAVLLVPNFVDRNDFFSSFPAYLKQHGEVSQLSAVPETFVPLIRMTLSGLRVDLVVSRLGTSYIPRHLNFDQPPGELYGNMDQISVHGLSGIHLAYELKKMMSGQPLFLPLLRVVRTWAKTRAINSFIYGFPPPIAWTVMVVYICKRLGDQSQTSSFCVCKQYRTNPTDDQSSGQNPRQEAVKTHSLSCLLNMFFVQFACWPWPHPVQIASIKFAADLNIFSWDPQRNAQDGRDLMPIITPVFPNKNAAFSVRQATRKVVVDELVRAREIISDILRGSQTWGKLFERYDIRNHHRHFLLLSLQATSKEELTVVGGLVDSRLRDLCQALEDEQSIRSTRIAPVQSSEKTSQPDPTGKHLCRQWLIGMDIEPGPFLPDGTRSRRNVDITGCLSTFYQILRERDASTDFGEKLTHVYLNRSQTMHLVL